MKNILLLSLISIGLLACNSPSKKTANYNQNEDNKRQLVTSQSAGVFTLGSAIPDSVNGFMINKTVEKRYTESGPVKMPVYTVSKKGEPLLTLHPNYNARTRSYQKIIDEIIITSPLFQTKKGIRVGSTIQKFTTVYPNFKLWYTYVSDRFVLENQHQGIQFLISEKDFIGNLEKIKSEKTMLKMSDFSDSATIYKIRIY